MILAESFIVQSQDGTTWDYEDEFPTRDRAEAFIRSKHTRQRFERTYFTERGVDPDLLEPSTYRIVVVRREVLQVYSPEP